jgi:hypothetical protein
METINFYKSGQCWVFDDKDKKIFRELMVAGADTLIDFCAQGKKKIKADFHVAPIKGYQLQLDLVETGGPPHGWTQYFCPEVNMPIGLCPRLYSFYPKGAPRQLFVRFEGLAKLPPLKKLALAMPTQQFEQEFTQDYWGSLPNTERGFWKRFFNIKD